MTITIHDNNDVDSVHRLQNNEMELMSSKMMYLNIFRQVTRPVAILPDVWKRVKLVDWIPNCPLPEDEVFMRLENLWSRHNNEQWRTHGIATYQR